MGKSVLELPHASSGGAMRGHERESEFCSFGDLRELSAKRICSPVHSIEPKALIHISDYLEAPACGNYLVEFGAVLSRRISRSRNADR